MQIPHTHTHMKGFVIPEFPALLAFREEFSAKLTETFPWLTEQNAIRMANGIQIDQMEAAAKEFGISYNRSEYEQFVADFLISSLESLIANPEFERITKTVPVVIAHPLSPSESKESRVRIFDMTDRERMRSCCRTLANMGVAFDVNMCTFTAPENNWENDPMVKTMRIAKECGIRFAFGTDAHSVEGLELIRRGDQLADVIGITESDLAPLVL